MGKGKNLGNSNEDGGELRRGPWTLEEDNLLIQYISCHGEGRWNSLAKFAGLKRTGKSCRLRWLNYLKPDIKRGNLTPHEQILILELHSRWGNRWSKIVQHLPGRTDNEIKNYWRTRVQKQARQLKVDSNSNKFLEAIRQLWMPRLLEKMEQHSSLTSSSSPSDSSTETQTLAPPFPGFNVPSDPCSEQINIVNNNNPSVKNPENSGYNLTPAGALAANSEFPLEDRNFYHMGVPSWDMHEMDFYHMGLSDYHVVENDWFEEDIESIFWNINAVQET